MKNEQKTGKEHMASAKGMNLPVSTKHGVVISDFLRYKTTTFAKSFLEDVIALKKAVPFKKFNRDTGHKAGMAAGRYPQKAANEFLRLVKSVEANAQMKGLNTSSLKIVKILANKASIPMTGGRHRRGTKRAHIEIEVKEVGKKKSAKVDAQKSKISGTAESGKKTVKEAVEKKETSAPVVKEEPKVEKKVEETKPEPVIEKEEVKTEPAKEEQETTEKEVVEVKEGEKAVEKVEEKPQEVIVKEEPKQEIEVKKEEIKEIVEKKEILAPVAKEEHKVEKSVEKIAEAVEEIKSEPVVEKEEVKPEPIVEEKVAEKVEEKTEVKEPETTEKKVVGAETVSETLASKEIKETSPQELLQMAQKKAAELNKTEKKSQDVENVENLYDELLKKGSLRDKGGKKQ